MIIIIFKKKRKYFWQKQKKTKKGFKRFNSSSKISTTNNFDVNRIAKHRSLDSLLDDERKSNLAPSNMHYQQIHIRPHTNYNNINNNNNNNNNTSLPTLPPDNSLQYLNNTNNNVNNMPILRSGGGTSNFNGSHGNQLIGAPTNSIYDSVVDTNSVRDDHALQPVITPSEIVLFRKEKKYDKNWARARSCYMLLILGLLFVTGICTLMLLLPRGVDVTSYSIETPKTVWSITTVNSSTENVTIKISISYNIDNQNLVPLTINEFYSEYYINCESTTKCKTTPKTQYGSIIGNITTDVTSKDIIVNRKSIKPVPMNGTNIFNITSDSDAHKLYTESCLDGDPERKFTLNINTRIKGSVALSQATKVNCNADVTIRCNGTAMDQTIFDCS